MSLETDTQQYQEDTGYPFPTLARYIKRSFYLLAIVAFAVGVIIILGTYAVDFAGSPVALLIDVLTLPDFMLSAIFLIALGVLAIFIGRFIWDGNRYSHIVALAIAIELVVLGWPLPFFGYIFDIFALVLFCLTVTQIDWPVNPGYIVKGIIACLFVLGIAEFIFGMVILSGNVIYGIFDFFGSVEVPEYLGLYIFHALFSVVLGFFTIQLTKPIGEKEPSSFSWSLYLSVPTIIFLLLLPTTIGYPLLIFSLSLIVLISFPPGVRSLWSHEFVEDMKPRLKETRYSLYLIRKSPLVVVGIIIIVSFVFIAIFADQLAPYGPEQRIWEDVADPPSPDHIWGVDEVGGDVYSRILWGAQVDLKISLQVVFIAVLLGTVIGASSGYYGGKLDELVMRITDVFFAFPGLILAMAIVMALGARNLENISIALMITWWPTYARLVRGQVLSEREKLYVEAARSVGASDSRILFFHIIPNTIQPLIVQATMDTGGVLLTAAGLSYIGFGASAGVAEWGLMISKGQEFLLSAPWMALYPGLAILLTALAFNLVGDGIRDILDPKLRRR